MSANDITVSETQNEFWAQPECWADRAELKRKHDSDTWTCDKCGDQYLSCSRCEQRGEWTFEHGENLKGWDCVVCQRWFCCSCFQHTGNLRATDDEWRCDACLEEK